MSGIIPLLQAASAAAWLGVLLIVGRYAWALVRHGEETARNGRAVLISFYAIIQIGFSVRWFLFGDAIHAMGAIELSLWAALYLLSIVSALLTAYLARIGTFDV